MVAVPQNSGDPDERLAHFTAGMNSAQLTYRFDSREK